MTRVTYKAAVQYDTSDVVSSTSKAERGLNLMSAASDRAAETMAQGSRGANILAESTERADAAARRMTRGQRAAQRAYERVAGAVDKQERQQIQLTQAQRALNRAVRAGVIDQQTYNRQLAKARTHYLGAESGISRYLGALRSARGLLASGGALAVGATGGAVARAGDQEQALLDRLELAFSGSREAAEQALETARELGGAVGMVNEFAEAMAKLSLRGFEPTKDQLVELADLAAGNVKSLDQLTEAVLDAQVGEFERLKEFGIRMRKVGDDIEVSFRGNSRVINNDAEEIASAIAQIGRQDFAGALADQSERLSARWAALKGNATQLAAALDQKSGLSRVSADFFGLVSSGLGHLTEWVTSGREINQMIADQTEILRQNVEAIEGRNAALEKFGTASAEGREVQSLLQERVRLEELSEQLEQRRASLENGLASSHHQQYSERLRAVNELLSQNSQALEDNFYNLQQARQAMALTAAIQRQYGDDLSKLTGITQEANEEDEERCKVLKKVEETQTKIQESQAQRLLREAEIEAQIRDQLRAAALEGASAEDLAALEERLRTLADLTGQLEFDKADSDTLKLLEIRDLIREIAAETQQLLALRDDLTFVPGLPVPLVNGPIDGDKTDDGPVIDLVGVGREELEQMAIFAGTSLFESLSGAIERAAANGKLSFRDLLSVGLSQSGNIATLGASIANPLSGENAVSPEQRRAAIEQAQQTAALMTGVFGAWFALYDAIDSWVDRKEWERANTGSVRLTQFLSGELSERIVSAGSAVRQLLIDSGSNAASYIEDLLFGLDASVAQISNQDIQLRVDPGGEYSVVFNSAVRSFGQNAQAAFDAFIIESLRQAEIEGGSDEVQRALRSTRADSLQQLEQELAIAQQIADLPLSQTERDLKGIDQGLQQLTRSALEMRLATESFANIGRSTVDDLLDLRNSITGGGPSELERRQGDALDFNAFVFGEFEEELRREAQDLHDQLAGLSHILGSDLDVLANVAAAGFTGVLSETQGGIAGTITVLSELTGQSLNIAGLTAAQADQIRGRLAAILEILNAFDSGTLSPINLGEIRVGGGGSRRQQRQDFVEELDRLRFAAAEGTSAVALSIFDMRRDLEEEAARLRKLGIAEALIQERIELEEELRKQGLLGSVQDRIDSARGGNEVSALLEQQRLEREELSLLNGTLEEMNELVRLQQEELALLAEQRERERRAAGDLVDGIGEYERQLLDLAEQYNEFRRQEIELAEARGQTAEVTLGLIDGLGRLDAEQEALARSIGRNFLASLQSAGVEIPGFSEAMIKLEFSLRRADLAALALDASFLQLIDELGLTIEGLFEAINNAEQAALDNLTATTTEAGVAPTPRDTTSADSRNLDIERVLQVIDDALDRLRGADPRVSEPQRFDSLLAEYEELLARARGGDVEAAEQAAQLALELQSLGQGLFGTVAQGRYTSIIDRFDRDLVELRQIVSDQLSPAEVQQEQLAVLVQIRDAIKDLGDDDGTDEGLVDPTDVPNLPRPPKAPGGGGRGDDFGDGGGRDGLDDPVLKTLGGFRDLEQMSIDVARLAAPRLAGAAQDAAVADALKALVAELRRQGDDKTVAKGLDDLVTEARLAREQGERHHEDMRLRAAAVEYGERN